jgi:hypothetical protein
MSKEILVKIWNISTEKVIQTAKNGIFLGTYFWLNLIILGTSKYNIILGLFSEKQSRFGMKSGAQFLRKKQWILPAFDFFSFSWEIK